MKKIFFNFPVKNKIERVEFRITFECPLYIFCECDRHPELRGFFTTGYIIANRVQ